MKVILLAIISLLFANGCGAYTEYHEFEGVSEIYNIRSPRILAQFLPESPTIIEVGAYQGRDTIRLAQAFPSAKIYAFEPLATAFSILSEGVQPYKHVSIFNACVDRTTGVRPFYICHGSDGQSPIYEFHSSLLRPLTAHLQGPIETVAVISLPDFCWTAHIDRMDMLWLSAEGNELQILEGAGSMLDQVSLVYTRSQFEFSRLSVTLFQNLKEFMEQRDFILLSHFHRDAVAGDALFVHKRKLDSCK